MPGPRALVVRLALPVVGLALGSASTSAQSLGPKAELTPVIPEQAIRLGHPLTIELRVELPEEIHVQSDAPREEYLIPTLLTFTLPEGVTVEEITYPPSTDYLLQGQSEPLAVFENEFTIDVRLALGEGVSPGEMVLPGRFQYQACDDRICFPPTTDVVEWRVNVDPGGTAPRVDRRGPADGPRHLR